MGSLDGTCEIVESRDDPNSSDYSKPNHQARVNLKGKKPYGCSKYLEDDINKLFETISVRTLSETGGATPRKNPSNKPMKMTMSTSSGIGYSEPVSLKQSLRRLCISQASETAALKRLSKPLGSPSLAHSGNTTNLYMSVVKASKSGTSVGKNNEVSDMQEEPRMKSCNNSVQSSPRLNLEKATKRVRPPVRLNEILSEPESGNHSIVDETIQEKNIISIPSPPCNIASQDSLRSVKSNPKVKLVNDHDKNNSTPSKVVNKAAPKLHHKGTLQSGPSSSSSSISTGKSAKSKSTRVPLRAVKTVVWNKTLVKKKSKQDLASVNAKLVPGTSQMICQRCHCTLKGEQKGFGKDPTHPPSTSTTTGVSSYARKYVENRFVVKNNKNPKRGDKGDFTQSSNSSVCEYSSSTRISEDRNPTGCGSIGSRPHMSNDVRWQAIHHTMKQNGFVGLRHFNLLNKLGCGDIGTVYLAELIGTNCPFAIKVMDNEFLQRRKKMPRAHMERDILRILDHPFLPTLYTHFVSENLSCLVTEYCPGGDLHVLRQKQPGRFFHEQAARFYVAEVLLALEYLHMLGIIYRDLKPENILVREDGHIMLTDFDLSLRCSSNPTLEPPRTSGPCAGPSCIDPFCIKPTCQVSCFRKPKPAPTPAPPLHRSLPQLVAEPTEARSNSFVGTHEYLAPEIVKGDGHGSAVDWWTFGVFLYELLYGKTPFKGAGNDETLANVVVEGLRFPETPPVSFQARDLIEGLLAKEPESRLGAKRGAAEIKRHPFFDGLNWALIRCALPPEVPEPYDGRLEFEFF